MPFKVKPNGATSPDPYIKTVYGVRFEEKEGAEHLQGETLFLFFEKNKWYWDYAFAYEPVE